MTLPRVAHRDPRRARLRALALALTGVCAIAALSLLCFRPPLVARAASYTRAPGGNFSNPVVRAVDVAEPAIVRLVTVYQAHITLTLCGDLVQLPRGGNYTFDWLGSGAFVSANGDILTADHVVHIDKESLDSAFFETQVGSQDIANAINAHAGCLGIGYRVGAGDIANGYVQAVGIPYSTSFSDPRWLAWQATSFSGPIITNGSDSRLKALLAAPHLDASLLTSSSFEENDLALLHVNLTDTPSIQLDDSNEVAVEDQLTIIGFPGNGDAIYNAMDLLTPSINTVTVSAIKYASRLIQVGGNVEHGDSGGPALDAAGHIVGVVSFRGDDASGSTAFLRSSNNVQALLTSAGVSNHPGTFQTLWEQAFTDYASTAPGHWHKASQELTALSQSYPKFKGVTDYQRFASGAAQTESSATTVLPVGQANVLAMVSLAALAVIVIVVVAIIIGLRRRGSRPAVAGATASQVVAPSPYAPYSAYGPGYYPQGPTVPYNTYGGNPYGPPAHYAPSGYAATHGYGTSGSSGYGDQSGAHALPPATGTAVGVETRTEVEHSLPPNGSSTQPPMIQHTPRPSPMASSSAPSWQPNTATQPATAEYSCTNGHAMPAGEIYCSVCGAPRQTTSTPTQYGW